MQLEGAIRSAITGSLLFAFATTYVCEVCEVFILRFVASKVHIIMEKRKHGSGKQCAVIGCYNSSKKMQNWKINPCEIHSPKLHCECVCLQPWKLHRFPGRADDNKSRRKWISNIHRKDYEPNDNSRVCVCVVFFSQKTDTVSGLHFLRSWGLSI